MAWHGMAWHDGMACHAASTSSVKDSFALSHRVPSNSVGCACMRVDMCLGVFVYDNNNNSVGVRVITIIIVLGSRVDMCLGVCARVHATLRMCVYVRVLTHVHMCADMYVHICADMCYTRVLL